MASSSSSYHSRSNSLPTRPHPLIPQIDDHLSRLRSSETASSSSSISHRLSGLADLHDIVNQFLQLPLTQQALAATQDSNKKWVENELDGSIKLLDFCSAIRDLLIQIKEHGQGLESVLRRRCSENEIAKEVAKYLQCRKKAVKAISHSFKDFKKLDSSCPLNMQRSEIAVIIIRTLKESAIVTANVLESILVMIGRGNQRKGCWSLVFKVMEPKRVVGCELLETDMHSCEFDDTDAVLMSLADKNATKRSDNVLEETAQNQLAELEACVKDLEQGLECVFRRLIKTRATLLNALC